MYDVPYIIRYIILYKIHTIIVWLCMVHLNKMVRMAVHRGQAV